MDKAKEMSIFTEKSLKSSFMFKIKPNNRLSNVACDVILTEFVFMNLSICIAVFAHERGDANGQKEETGDNDFRNEFFSPSPSVGYVDYECKWLVLLSSVEQHDAVITGQKVY